MHKVHREFITFAFAGAFGFLIDSGVLYLMLWLGAGPYVGRVVSFLCAVFATWQINRRFTFKDAQNSRGVWREAYEYLLAMLVGGLCNYAAYATAIKLLSDTAVRPLLAVAVGSIAGMFVNFLIAKVWVFKTHKVEQSR
ncbi:GtrA-like protein [Caballeronia cordobensis]|uniref:GtrA-like protein n=1 Tax=Caballeronia cordobensis TaxID=1353886 RepID=A0A158JLK4_CABCO|nr:GtrA family protein [Caballeronia cordobensis]SAL69361.1 GtrA-like protein [Caballeronia cordobensis]